MSGSYHLVKTSKNYFWQQIYLQFEHKLKNKNDKEVKC